MLTRKKVAYRVLVLAFTVTFGVSVFTTVAFTQTATREGWPKKIVIAVTGGEMGPMYGISGGLGRLIEKYLRVSVSLTSVAGHDADYLIHRGQAHIASPSVQSIPDVLHGTGPDKKLGPTPFRAWLQALVIEANTIALDKSGIKSFPDLKGKIICIGPSAVPVPDLTLKGLSVAYGFDLKDVKVVKWDRPEEAYDGLKVGKFDAIQMNGVYPTPSTTELFLSHAGRIFHVDDAHMAMIRKQFPWITPQIIPAGTYKGMDKDVQTAAVAMFLATHRDLPESFVYAMTKMIWEHFDEFSSFHPMCKKFRAADVTKIVDLCPYHNGAIKYYREAGVWTKELDQRQAAILASIPLSVR
jgi:TRAP transporter TAXI family solute receptor